LTLSAVTQGYFKEDKFKFVDINVPNNSHLWIKKDDILLQRANSLEYVGISAIYEGEDDKYIYPDLMMKFRANESVLPKYLHCALLSDDSRKYLRDNATGTAGNMPKVNQETVSNIPINTTTLVEQIEIVRITEELLSKATVVEKQYKAAKVRLDKLTQSILAKAFRGELLGANENDQLEQVIKASEAVHA
jgi:type I restriction enzyme S subunit